MGGGGNWVISWRGSYGRNDESPKDGLRDRVRRRAVDRVAQLGNLGEDKVGENGARSVC